MKVIVHLIKGNITKRRYIPNKDHDQYKYMGKFLITDAVSFQLSLISQFFRRKQTDRFFVQT